MISYEPFYETLFKKGVTEYNLIFKQGFSANTFHRMKKGEAINTKTLDALCYALDCEVGDIIEFEQEETLATERIDKDNLIIPEKFAFMENSKSFEITKEIFEPDALILSDIKSEKLTIKGDNTVEFTFGKCPFLGIWAKPGAPYVCIEPWHGVNDGREVKADISEKRGIQHLNEGETFEFSWTAEIK